MTYARDMLGLRPMWASVTLVMGLGPSFAYGQAKGQADAAVRTAGTSAEAVTLQEAKGEDPTAALEGLWPSPELMRLFLVRMVDRVTRRYELDDKQSRKLQDATVERWTRFAAEHRRELQPLLNEFLEIRMGLKPPPKERVKAWAERLQPVFELYRAEFDKAVDEFREMLSPTQRAKFEVDELNHRAGLELAESKIRRWKEGVLSPQDLWDGPGVGDGQDREPETRAEEGRQGSAIAFRETEQPAGLAAPIDQIALELLRWEAYVARFIRLYELDEGQRDAVRSCLIELQRRAMAHRDRYWDQIVALEQRIAQQPAEEAKLAAIEDQLVELYGPVDDMFQELQERIHKIPTEAQRAAARDADDQLRTPAGGMKPQDGDKPRPERDVESP